MAKKADSCFIITYRDPKEEKIIQLKAKTIADSSLGLGFVTISDFVFSTGNMVLNPAEEQLKNRFKDVRALHVSIYTILSVEEVGPNHKGLSFEKDKSNLVVLGPTSNSNNPTSFKP